MAKSKLATAGSADERNKATKSPDSTASSSTAKGSSPPDKGSGKSGDKEKESEKEGGDAAPTAGSS